MPYTSDRITFGKPKNEWDAARTAELAGDLEIALALTRRIAGVRLLNTREAYDSLEAPEVRGKMAYCQMIEQATRGKTFRSTRQHHACDGGTTALALEHSSSRIESGDEYYSYNLFASPAAARRLRASIARLPPQTETYGLLTGPLRDFPCAPDLVVCVAPPYGIMRLVQGWEYRGGKKPVIDLGAMQGMCAELGAGVLLRGSMNVSVLCPSTRMLCKWKDEEMAAALPFEAFQDLVDGVFGTMETTDNREKKRAAIESFKKIHKTLDIDPEKGY